MVMKVLGWREGIEKTRMDEGTELWKHGILRDCVDIYEGWTQTSSSWIHMFLSTTRANVTY